MGPEAFYRVERNVLMGVLHEVNSLIGHCGLIDHIHNWSLQPFSQDYWPSFSYHLCCVC